MRPSAASLRSSIAAPPSAETLAGLNQKKKEAEAVDALQRASALFLQRLEGLADDCEAMADAGAGAWVFSHYHRGSWALPIFTRKTVLGEVLAQWPQMFRIMNLFCMFIRFLCDSLI